MTWELRNDVSPHNGAALVAAASGASVAALGGLVVAGWLTVAVALIQVLPGLPPKQYNTAHGYMICGAAMLAAGRAVDDPQTHPRHRRERVCGGKRVETQN